MLAVGFQSLVKRSHRPIHANSWHLLVIEKAYGKSVNWALEDPAINFVMHWWVPAEISEAGWQGDYPSKKGCRRGLHKLWRGYWTTSHHSGDCITWFSFQFMFFLIHAEGLQALRIRRARFMFLCLVIDIIRLFINVVKQIICMPISKLKTLILCYCSGFPSGRLVATEYLWYVFLNYINRKPAWSLAKIMNTM